MGMYNENVATSIVHNRGVSIGTIGAAQLAEIATLVARAEQELKPDVVRIRYELREDYSGDAAIYFRVVLADKAADKSHLRRSSTRAAKVILEHVSPLDLGLLWYFNYRSASEQASLREPSW